MKPQIKFEKATRDDVIGIGRRGHIEMDYARMVLAFGEPNDCTKEGPWRSSDRKVRREWAFKIVDKKKPIVLTIYDYKQPNTPIEQNRDWHIGIKGHGKTAIAFVISRLESTYVHCPHKGSVVLERPDATNEAQHNQSRDTSKIRHTGRNPRRQMAHRQVQITNRRCCRHRIPTQGNPFQEEPSSKQ